MRLKSCFCELFFFPNQEDINVDRGVTLWNPGPFVHTPTPPGKELAGFLDKLKHANKDMLCLL